MSKLANVSILCMDEGEAKEALEAIERELPDHIWCHGTKPTGATWLIFPCVLHSFNGGVQWDHAKDCPQARPLAEIMRPPCKCKTPKPTGETFADWDKCECGCWISGHAMMAIAQPAPCPHMEVRERLIQFPGYQCLSCEATMLELPLDNLGRIIYMRDGSTMVKNSGGGDS